MQIHAFSAGSWRPTHAAPAFGERPTPGVIAAWADALGRSTGYDANTGMLYPNEALIAKLAAQKDAAVPVVDVVLRTGTRVPQLVEALLTAQQLAAQHVPGVRALYAAAAHLNETTEPLLQIYLAGFYRVLNVPESYGPLLTMFWRNAARPASPLRPRMLDPQEEIGGALLSLTASATAQAMRRESMH